jgi:hypothetical protein
MFHEEPSYALVRLGGVAPDCPPVLRPAHTTFQMKRSLSCKRLSTQDTLANVQPISEYV